MLLPLLAIIHIFDGDNNCSYCYWTHLIPSVTPSAYTKEVLNEYLLNKEKEEQCVLTSRKAFALV